MQVGGVVFDNHLQQLINVYALDWLTFRLTSGSSCLALELFSH